MQKLLIISSLTLLQICCSHAPALQTEQYATLKSEKTFEYDLFTVWKAVETTMNPYSFKTDHQDHKNFSASDDRSLMTDWVYSQSRTYYQNYLVNNLPTKTFLPMRMRYHIIAKKTLGGTHVIVKGIEEIQKLKADGSWEDYEAIAAESTWTHEILEKIESNLLVIAKIS